MALDTYINCHPDDALASLIALKDAHEALKDEALYI
jgi:hypothetical protein